VAIILILCYINNIRDERKDMKELWIEMVDRMVEELMDSNPNMDWSTAYDLVCHNSAEIDNRLQEYLGDAADYYHDMAMDR
jgi:hypothetical protein